ncbi:MAG TPA: 50S ribosomal protein L11 methyltransferase, partial [Candidatus Limnocylindria bacterium]|nr:50S ribosomal protein L11 methyltransferase [Candidatus Limnocylindria bacterium]
MRWLELTVEADAEAVEAVSEILGRLGQGAAVRPTRLLRDPDDELSVREDPTAPYELTAHVADDPAAPAAIEATERALWHLQAFGLRPVGTLRVRPVDERDWTEGWKEGYAPQRIGRLLIVPTWLDAPADEEDVVVRLDPGMAFGTGLHPTTRGCLELLQRIGPMPPRVLDVGSGSGILGIAALALGAGHVDALDTDPVAVEVTQENARRNGVDARLAVRAGTLEERCADPYPLLLANLVAAVLIELAPRLAAHSETDGI